MTDLPIINLDTLPENDELVYYLLWLNSNYCVECKVQESPLWRKCIGAFNQGKMVIKVCNKCGIQKRRADESFKKNLKNKKHQRCNRIPRDILVKEENLL